jgi:hypothetical protein
MGDWQTELRDRQLLKSLGKTRLRGRVVQKLRKGELEPLVVYSDLKDFIHTLGTQQMMNRPRVPRWKELSPWMKIQLGHLAICEFTGQAFTVHIAEHLLTKLDTVENRADYLRRRFAAELRSVFERTPAYFFVIEFHNAYGLRVGPHVHGCIEIEGVTEDDVRRSLRRACGHDEDRGPGKHNAYLGEKPYGRVERWGRYICKGLRRKAPDGWKRRHATSNDLIGSAREFWGFIEDNATIAMAKYSA